MEAMKKTVTSLFSSSSGLASIGIFGVVITASLGYFEIISKAAEKLSGTVAQHDVYLVGIILWAAVMIIALVVHKYEWMYSEHKELRKAAETERDDMKLQLRESREEIVKERESSKAQHRADSEEWYNIDELRKIETREREKAERERDALKHQISNQQEEFLKMKIPLQKMEAHYNPTLKIQALEKNKELAAELKNEKKRREECEIKLNLVTQERDHEIQTRKDTETQRDEQIKLGEDVTRERDEERQTKEEAQQRIVELEKLHSDEKSLREKGDVEVNSLTLIIGRLTAEKEACEKKLQGKESSKGWPWSQS